METRTQSYFLNCLFVLLPGEKAAAMVVADRRDDIIKLSLETRHKD